MRRMWRLSLGNERGVIFIASLVFVLVMTILAVALFTLSRIEGALAIGDSGSNQLLYCAEAALGRTMADFTAGGRMAQISAALGTNNTTITLTPNPETVTTSAPGALTCSTTVTFTTFNPTTLTTGLLQATATAPNGAKRRVRIQLQNLSFQAWNSGDLNQNGGPYWDRASLEGGSFNIGDWMANTGTFAGSTVGPGAIPFWGQSYNAATDPNPGILPGLTGNGLNADGSQGPRVYCTGTGVGCANSNILIAKGNGAQPNQVTLTAQWTNTGTVGTDHFGWFESDANGTIGTTHEIVNGGNCIVGGVAGGNGNCTSPTAVSFTPTTNYYGFYLTNNRGTMYSLAGLAASSGYTANRFTPSPNDCPGCNPGPAAPGSYMCTDPGCPSSSTLPWIPYQHFTVFRQDATTYWIGLEDLYNLGRGNKCSVWNGSAWAPVSTAYWSSCIYRTNVDQDYQDMIIQLKVPNGDTVLNQGADPRAWKDWQECSVSATPPAC